MGDGKGPYFCKSPSINEVWMLQLAVCAIRKRSLQNQSKIFSKKSQENLCNKHQEKQSKTQTISWPQSFVSDQRNLSGRNLKKKKSKHLEHQRSVLNQDNQQKF